MHILQCRIRDGIQPFERELAFQEIRALCLEPSLSPIDGTNQTANWFKLNANGAADRLRERLTYWQAISAGDGKEDLTLQIRCEKGDKKEIPRRKNTRYATHGLHEYRGKFFPQLASALINISAAPSDGIVVDPMCGSGTTLVEALLTGKRAYGFDMNPLAVFVSSVKCQVLSLPPDSLLEAFEDIESALLRGDVEREGYHTTLDPKDRNYLVSWFASETLGELDRVHAAIRQLSETSIRNFFLVCLSNILRSVSWQKEKDLRTRKEKVDLEKGEAVNRFLSESRRSVASVSSFIAERGRLKTSVFEVFEGDASDSFWEYRSLRPAFGKVDAVVTSPPYATALPYIDTDRLSLIYLGLLSRARHAARDRMMIGNREISDRLRDEYREYYTTQKSVLPSEVCQVIDRIDRLNNEGDVGFRRKNLAALLSKYFFDMRRVLINIRSLLRSRGVAFLVVGSNRTIAGGELVEIRTADHLATMAEDLQFKVLDTHFMQMLPSRDIFRKNAGTEEKIIRLESPGV